MKNLCQNINLVKKGHLCIMKLLSYIQYIVPNCYRNYNVEFEIEKIFLNMPSLTIRATLIIKKLNKNLN